MSCGAILASITSVSPLGHDQHDRLAGGDHATDGVHRKLVHGPRLRRADIDPLQLVFGGHAALPQFRLLGLDIAHLLADFRLEVLIELDDLQFGLGNPALGPGDISDQHRAFAVESRCLALYCRVLEIVIRFLAQSSC